MLDTELKFSYKDVSIVPAAVSPIDSRKDCNPYVEEGTNKLPLFTAPMDSVIGINNMDLWVAQGITPIIPRTESLTDRLQLLSLGYWVAMSLGEFEEYFVKSIWDGWDGKFFRVLIDIANGHMEKLYNLVRSAKAQTKNLIVMVGNIANPETYLAAARACADYVRVGIGVGRGCITSSNTGVGYPMASLLNEISSIKKRLSTEGGQLVHTTPLIVADGGVRGYSDAVKALALGADRVMIGSVFTKMLESAAPGTVSWVNPEGKQQQDDLTKFMGTYRVTFGSGEFMAWKDDNTLLGPVTIKKTFYGMASKRGQLAMNGKKTHTSEGIETTLDVEYTMQAWVENFTDYLRSAMSYAGARDLQQFTTNTKLVTNSVSAITSINR